MFITRKLKILMHKVPTQTGIKCLHVSTQVTYIRQLTGIGMLRQE